MFSLNTLAQIYTEGDVLNPTLNLLGSTRQNVTDVRLGYLFGDWDVSGRYYNTSDIEATGSYAGTGKARDAVDTFASLRLGYVINGFTFGGGIGSYNREIETTLSPTIKSTKGKNVMGLEAFVSYKWSWNGFFVKPELNYIAADVPTHISDTDGGNSYDSNYSAPTLNLFALIGYEF
jgi:hypothetical protein